MGESLVGKPGTPDSQRTRVGPGIWRYHPERRLLEAVAQGAVNPWGLDFDDHGEAFFVGCVIEHLWHLVPGAHHQRTHDKAGDRRPFTYELIPAASDHLHWGGGDWQSSRGGAGVHSEAGGGHAHAGGMIYLGDNWPDSYRNSIFMCNIHGNRVNRDLLIRQGNSYVGKHAADFIRADNPWFRGVGLHYGPDGGVFVNDWCDLGECHDYDGVHRSSGRIYKISYGTPRAPINLDLSREPDAALVQRQLHKNDWYVRHARRLLTERALSGKPMALVHKALTNMFQEHPDVTRKLRALWALYTTGGTSESWLCRQLDHADEHVRSWVVRLLVDRPKPGAEVLRKFTAMARDDKSGLVRLYLASALQRLELADRFPIAVNLSQHDEDAQDPSQPLMIWYGIEPAVPGDRTAALDLAAGTRTPKLRQFIIRRLTEAAGAERAESADLDPLMEFIARAKTPAVQRDALVGLRQGLKGHKDAPMPDVWKSLYPRLADSGLAEVRESAHALGLLFGDRRALAHLGKTLVNQAAPPADREYALVTLAAGRPADLLPSLLKLLEEPDLRGPAIRALAAYHHPDIPKTVLGLYKSLTVAEKQDAINTLASRPSYALALLAAIERKQVPRGDVSTFTARQLKDLRDRRVTEKLDKVWGQIRQTPTEKKVLIAKYKALLTPQALAGANLPQGRAVFNRTCYQCHTLFGAGNKIGPDLTGSNRFDLHYVLENLIDPSAAIADDYRLTNIVTAGGRLISGIIVEETQRAVTVQTAAERLVLAKSDIEERRRLSISMMPEGQIEQLSFTELRDLVGYLASKEQVPLPK
jgi:putative heme-binding domain-containing protein